MTNPETCEDRDYQCCDRMPPPYQPTWDEYADWYTAHVLAYLRTD